MLRMLKTKIFRIRKIRTTTRTMEDSSPEEDLDPKVEVHKAEDRKVEAPKVGIPDPDLAAAPKVRITTTRKDLLAQAKDS